jgi:hypothetical protein
MKLRGSKTAARRGVGRKETKMGGRGRKDENGQPERVYIPAGNCCIALDDIVFENTRMISIDCQTTARRLSHDE